MFGHLGDIAIYVVPFLVILTVVIAVHELGHFYAAKACGVAIDRFSLGFGKAIFKRTDRHGVEWRIGSIPLGGYVRFAGDTNDASVPDNKDLAEMRRQIEEKLGAEAVSRFYAFKPVWQRAIIAAAGPFANFLLAILIFACVLMAGVMGRPAPIVTGIAPGSAAAAAGFMPGDVVIRAGSREIRHFDELSTYVKLRAGDKVKIDVRRGDEVVPLYPTIRAGRQSNGITKALIPMGELGVIVSGKPVFKAYSPPAAVVEGGRMVWGQIDTTVTYISRIFRGREDGRQISGIIGMGNASGKIAKQTIEQASSPGELAYLGGLRLVLLMASISVGIGFVNLLPIPMLDGGHLVFYAYEAIARRPMGAQVQAASYRVGLALVLGLMLFATWNDLQNLQAFQFLGGLFS